MGVKVKGMTDVVSELKKVERLDIPLNRATRKVQRGLKTDASEEIRTDINWKKSYVDKGLNTYAQLATAQRQETSITLSAQKRGALLRNFRHSMTKNGLKIEITKGKTELIKRAFKIRLRNGVETVAWRKQKGSKRMDLALHGPSPSQILDTKQDIVKDKGVKRFEKAINHEVEWYLKNGK